MALNREKRRRLALKGKTYYGEIVNPLMIADLKVYVNKEMPDGVMIVSVAEGERLKKLIDDASEKDTAEAVEQHARKAEAEAKEMTFTPARIVETIEGMEKNGAKVSNDTHAIYALDTVTFEGKFSEYPLDIVIVPAEAMPDDTYLMVAKRATTETQEEGK